jgi:hypothetical protein
MCPSPLRRVVNGILAFAIVARTVYGTFATSDTTLSATGVSETFDPPLSGAEKRGVSPHPERAERDESAQMANAVRRIVISFSRMHRIMPVKNFKC